MSRAHRFTAGAVALAATLLSAGPLLAADIQSTATYSSGRWVVSAPMNGVGCYRGIQGLHDPRTISLAVDDAAYSATAETIFYNNPLVIELPSSVPNDSLSDITLLGQCSFLNNLQRNQQGSKAEQNYTYNS